MALSRIASGESQVRRARVANIVHEGPYRLQIAAPVLGRHQRGDLLKMADKHSLAARAQLTNTLLRRCDRDRIDCAGSSQRIPGLHGLLNRPAVFIARTGVLTMKLLNGDVLAVTEMEFSFQPSHRVSVAGSKVQRWIAPGMISKIPREKANGDEQAKSDERVFHREITRSSRLEPWHPD